MSTGFHDTTAGTQVSSTEATGRLVIARFRTSLRRSLGNPCWQDAMEAAASGLGIPTQRQGVGLARALIALAIDQQRSLLGEMLARPRSGLDGRAGRELAQAWGIQLPSIEFREPNWPKLSREIRLRLASRYTNYKEAQNRLFERYQELAKQTANSLCLSSSRRDDCLQEGYLGLLQAIDRAKTEGSFASYARYWIRRRIRNYLMRNSLPVSAPANAISRATREERNPAATGSAEKASLRELTLAIRALQNNASPPDAESLDVSLTELWAANRDCPIASVVRQEMADLVQSLLRKLTDKQNQVLQLRFGVGDRAPLDTMQGVARLIGISRQQAAEREKRALARLASLLEPFAHELA